MDIKIRLAALFRQHSNGNLTEAVYHTIKDAIAAEFLPDGTKLNEVELAEWFQVSRTPVQKALIKLESEELITCEHKRGYMIQQLDFKQSTDINEFYLGLYTMTIILAMNRRIDNYYEQLLKKRLFMLQQENDIQSFLRLDHDFHRQIAHSTGNKELINTLNRTDAKGNLMFLFSKKCPVDSHSFIKKHNKLNNKLYDLLMKDTLTNTVSFMENEHNPHMKELVGVWNHPDSYYSILSLRE